MILYKYASPKGVGILRHRRIHLCHPIVFNDPFDFSPHYGTTVTVRAGSQPPFSIPGARLITKGREAILKSAVVLSLTARRNSLLMWAHYAAAHTGFAIGFDPAKGVLSSPSRANRVLRPVIYSRRRPSRATGMDLTDRDLLTKSSQWKYEAEWRLMDVQQSADYPPSKDGHRWPFAIRPDGVALVILGCRSSEILKARVITELRKPHFSHVRLLQAHADEKHFRLHFREIRQSQW